MKSISEAMAQATTEFSSMRFADISQSAVVDAKRCLLDSLGIAVGGYGAPVCNILSSWAREAGGQGEATLIGEGLRVPTTHAAIVNGTLLRYWDYLDTYVPPIGATWHGAEIIPAVIAVGESVHASGTAILKSIILGYELGGRLCDVALVSNSIGPRGIHHGTLGFLVVPAAVGPLLGMTSEQIADAIGIAGNLVVLGAVDAMPHEPNTMAKNVAFPLASSIGITAAQWAKRGFTGTRRVFEGYEGLIETVLGEDYDVPTLHRKLFLPWKQYAIEATSRKMYPVCAPIMGAAQAVYQLVTKNDISPDMVESVTVLANKFCVSHNGDPDRLYANNKETADHSLPFAVAVLLSDKELGLEQFSVKKLHDPRVAALARKIEVKADPARNHRYDWADVEIRMKDGRVFSASVDAPKGTPGDPMNDGDIRDKFRKVTAQFLSPAKANECIDAVSDLENCADIGSFMKHFIFR